MCAHLWRADACAQGEPVARTAGGPYANGDSQEYVKARNTPVKCEAAAAILRQKARLRSRSADSTLVARPLSVNVMNGPSCGRPGSVLGYAICVLARSFTYALLFRSGRHCGALTRVRCGALTRVRRACLWRAHTRQVPTSTEQMGSSRVREISRHQPQAKNTPVKSEAAAAILASEVPAPVSVGRQHAPCPSSVDLMKVRVREFSDQLVDDLVQFSAILIYV